MDMESATHIVFLLYVDLINFQKELCVYSISDKILFTDKNIEVQKSHTANK